MENSFWVLAQVGPKIKEADHSTIAAAPSLMVPTQTLRL